MDQVLAGMARFPTSALAEVLACGADLQVTRDSTVDMLLDEVARWDAMVGCDGGM